MNTKDITRTGVTVALLAVSAWVTVPFGPVPFTLQTLALAMIPAMLNRTCAIASVCCYVLLGAIGLPMFSSMQGGIGVLAGPTGGFLWGFILGILAAMIVERVLPERLSPFARALVADVCMLLVAYVCGTVQLMAVAQMSLMPALMAAVIPFIIPDAVKLACGARIGCAVAKAVGR